MKGDCSMPVDRREFCAVAHMKGKKHKIYEDSFRMLPRELPLVQQCGRGEIFAVFDGIGGAPEGRRAAQHMADRLIAFYRQRDIYPPSRQGLETLLLEANIEIAGWGFMPGTDRPLGGCAGTVAWVLGDKLHIFHAGDTTGVLVRDGKAVELTQAHQTADGAIYKYFGLGKDLTLFYNQTPIEEEDRILLISDGITKVKHPIEAAEMLNEYKDIAIAVNSLAVAAQAAGSNDDITVLLLEAAEIWE
jgi:serine/threonine protein phosphatase PrpC